MADKILLEDLRPAEGSTGKSKRVGRGRSSGHGKTSCRGHNGEGQRSGRTSKRGFEGGQMPLYRRLPKRGFTNRNTKDIVAINVDRLNVFEDGDVVTITALVEKGVISNPRDGVKVLGNGTLEKKLTVKVSAVSQGAKEKIEALGGSVEEN